MANKNYYSVERITPSTLKISEQDMLSMYLVMGSERACLIDTGYGLGDLTGLIASLTDLPVTVVNTHGHVDHTLGNHLFSCALMNRADARLYEQHTSPEEVRGMLNSEEGRRLLHLAKTDDEINRLDADSFKPCPVKALRDGDFLNLGNKKLEVMLMPGHTAGSIILIDRSERVVYSGDAIIEHPWLFLDESLSPQVYLDSLKRAKKHLEGIELIYNGHFAWHPMKVADIDGMIDGMQSIIDGKAEGVPFTNFAGSGLEYTFGDWSVCCRA